MANEILYKIFEYLDTYHVFEGFLNINSRFQTLLFDSTLPIKIGIPTVWKSNFEHYYKDMIIPNKHHINVLRLSDPFIVDMFATSPHLLSTFICLETRRMTTP
jgi:hypothetical protein